MTLGLIPFHSGIHVNVLSRATYSIIFYADLKSLSPVVLAQRQKKLFFSVSKDSSSGLYNYLDKQESNILDHNNC